MIFFRILLPTWVSEIVYIFVKQDNHSQSKHKDMANGVNKVILVGHLGKDPEVQNFENGLKKANFSLATTDNFKNKEGVQHTEWHNIVVWSKLAEIAEKWLKKGSLIFLEGRIRTRQWEDKEGNKRYTTEILGDNFQMLGSGSGGQKGQGTGEYESGGNTEVSNEGSVDLAPQEDDLPF